MRKHRLHGFVLAMLLGTGALAQLPNHRNHRLLFHLTDTRHARAHAADPLRPASKGQVSGLALMDAKMSLQTFEELPPPQPSAPEPPPSPPPAATPPPPPPPPTPAPAPAAAPAVTEPSGPSSSTWANLRECESHDNYADDTGNGYYGAYQFDLSTWESLGYSGLPSDAPPSVQDQAAQELQARSGWGQWPACSRQLGLT
jgi:hypothetical protein